MKSTPLMSCVVLLGLLLLVMVSDVDHIVTAVSAKEPAACKVGPSAKTPEDAIGDATPTFVWQALPGCTSYQLYLANDVAILSITWVKAEAAGCANGSGNCTYKPEHLLVEDDYRWWIRGWQPHQGTSKWSVGTRFTIDLDVCAQQPQPVTPIDNTVSSTPVYRWQSVYGCTWYQLSVTGPEGNVLSQWVNADETGCEFGEVCSFEPGDVLPSGSYLWWIRGWSRGTRIGRWTIATSFDIEAGRQ